MTQMNKNWWLFTLLLMPLLAAQMMHNTSLLSVLFHILISASLVLLLTSAQQLTNWLKPVLKFALLLFYFIFLFMLMFEVILFDFTGKGFTNEVYFHFELESVRISFNQYPVQILAFLSLVFIYIILLNKILKKIIHKNHILIPLGALVLLVVLTFYSPVARFISGFGNYLWQDSVELDQDLIKQYVDLDVIQNSVITTKKELVAQAKLESKNLILVYLESFNKGLLNLDQYPDLTPQLNLLSKNYQNLNHISSSYVTIEGIISSQCGTMLPMTAGNNTFLNEGHLLSNMPCLGDVLNKAGYSQYYLGGAQMEFAGKGSFLETHGYDHVWGLEHWKANGLRETKGIWGLSDTQLFKNALDTVKEAAKNPPYNMTLLTLGTHLPGYVYAECQPYPGSDEAFINAIHCTDQLVGQFVKELERAELLDNTVLMIVADHGIFPSAKMKELFGDEVDDRRLIGITNYQPLPDEKISSYDLAPTLLDMLNINHNAHFIYGQSLFEKTKNHQKYATRYADWQGEKMVLNPAGECTENQKLDWPLNKCQKHQLLNMTSQLLADYSIKNTPEPLTCILDIKFVYEKHTLDKWQWSLWLNEEDHFGHFYHNGYLLKTNNYRAGNFIFVLNDELAIVNHIYFENDDRAEANFRTVLKSNYGPLLVIQSKIQPSSTSENGEAMSLEINFYHQQKKIWTETTNSDVINGINICQ